MPPVLDKIKTLAFWLEGALPFLLVLLIYYALLLTLRRLCSKGRLEHNWLSVWRHLVWFAWIIALYQPLVFFVPQFSQSFESLGKVFTSPLSGNGPSLLSLLWLLPVFFVANRLAASLVKLLEFQYERNRSLKKRIHRANIIALLVISRYILLLLFCLLGISLIGINLSSLSVILGALGLGIGLGLQNMAANFFSGITLLLSGHIRTGDFVRTPKASGTVERISLLSTIVQTTEYENLIIPNQYLLNEIIENASYGDNHMVQLHLPLGVSYESNLEQVVALLKELLKSNPWQPENPPSEVWLKGFGPSSIDLEVRMMIESIHVYLEATHWFYLEVWRAFREQGWALPFNQLDVHIKRDGGSS